MNIGTISLNGLILIVTYIIVVLFDAVLILSFNYLKIISRIVIAILMIIKTVIVIILIFVS